MGMETIEYAQFKVAQGVDEKAFLKASDGIMPDLRKTKGFVSRKLVRGDDGVWADIVRWKTLEDALNLAKEFEKIESCHNYLSMIDQSTVKISHHELVKSY